MSLCLLSTIKMSFQKYLTTGSRSNEKLKILHAKIASDLRALLGNEYRVDSLDLNKGKERKIDGRYINKIVDITISKSNGEIVGGIAVKFVMSNYSQNSNNYFENMLGETANIRCSSIPYFQIIIIPDEMPYYDKKGIIKKIEWLTDSHVEKYVKLSEDDPRAYQHTPDKTLLMVVALPPLDTTRIKKKNEYVKAYGKANIQISTKLNPVFKPMVILNDYNQFIQKVVYRIKAI